MKTFESDPIKANAGLFNALRDVLLVVAVLAPGLNGCASAGQAEVVQMSSHSASIATVDDPAALYARGRNEKIPPQEALELIRRAAKAGYGPAQEALARSYTGEHGVLGNIRVPRDYKAALYWALQHAHNENGDLGGRPRTLSMGLAAWLYFYGHVDGSPNYALARQWAEKSAKDSRHARLVMWKLYEEGLGVEKDILRAEYWRFRLESPSSPYAVLGGIDWALERKLLLSSLVFTGRADRLSVINVRLQGAPIQRWLEAEIAVEDVLKTGTDAPKSGDAIKVIVAFSDKNRTMVERDFLGKSLLYPVALRGPVYEATGDARAYYSLVGHAGDPSPISLDRRSHVEQILVRIRELGLTTLY